MEVSQAIWLMVVLFDALLISPKRFDEIILDFYQDAGIWIVIASCVAEYLLLLTYIGVAAYDFFKNRKMMKKMNVQRRTYEFLKFDESHRDVGNRLHNAASLSRPAGGKIQAKANPRAAQTSSKSSGQIALFSSQRPKIRQAPRSRPIRQTNGSPSFESSFKLRSAGSVRDLNDWRERLAFGQRRISRMNKSLKRKQIE